ncbi:MAG: hypothetical protein GKR90_17725 [Pseudomonadales bacterium]|nr:hypothetical protein [Pseudomonadales bacterium]
MAKICNQAQDWLDHHYSFGHAIALRYFSMECTGRINRDDFDPKTDTDLLAHVKECSECYAWIVENVGLELLERQKRLTEYCCPVLFGAVEEPKGGNLQLKLTPYPQRDGGHNWSLSLDSGSGEESTLIVNFCPFCGNLIQTADHSSL